MKTLFISANFFLLGFLLFVAIVNSEFGFEPLLIISLCLYAVLLVIAVLYASGKLVNNFLKWFLFLAYAIASIMVFGLVIIEGGDIIEIVVAVLVIGSLIFSAYYMFVSEGKLINFDDIYTRIAKEKEENYVDEGLWMRAVTMSGGNEKKTEGVYIKLRAKKLAKETKNN